MGGFSSCANDQLPEPIPPTFCDTITATYNTIVKDIIDTQCGVSPCHIPGGNGPGDYRTFDGVRPSIENGLFKERVIDLIDDFDLGMPPEWNEDGPNELTDEQREIIECWIAAGYPEM